MDAKPSFDETLKAGDRITNLLALASKTEVAYPSRLVIALLVKHVWMSQSSLFIQVCL